MKTLSVISIIALALGTCADVETPHEGPTLSALPAEAGPLDGLNRRHARLRHRMRRRGYGEDVGLSRAFLLEDRGVVWPLDLAVGQCSTLIALGGGAIRDLSLTLFDDEGEVAATDTVEGEGGLLHVCPQADAPAIHRPYYLELRTLEGFGAVMVAHFRSSLGAGEGFDGLFEGVLAPRVPFRDVEEHLARSRTALRARGFELVIPPRLEAVSEGGMVRQRAPLEGGRCYVVSGRGGDGIEDIDLFLFDAAGVEVARDIGTDVEPSIEHCPDETERHIVELRAYEGAGPVGMMLLVGPGPDDDAAQPDESVDEGGPEDGDPGLALDVLVAPLLDRGFSEPVFMSRDAAIVPGEVRTHDVVVGPGCALIAGTASHEAMDLDLYLADEGGREVDRDTAVQSTARVRACRETPTVMRVAVKGYGRDGGYALAILRAPARIHELQALRLEEVTAAYRLRGFTERSRFDAEIVQGEPLRRQLVLEPGHCVAIAAAGDDDVRDVDIFLRDVSEELSASDSGPAPHAVVSRCAETERERLTVDVEVHRGGGRVELLVLDLDNLPDDAPEEDPVEPPDPASTPLDGSEGSIDREADDARGGL